GSGGVGSFAIQIGKARGAKVIATASTANQDLLKELGADVAIDYTKQKFEDVAKDVDVVLDSVGEDTLARSYGVVKRGGFIVSLVARPERAGLDKHGIRGAALSVEPNSDELAQIGKLIDQKKIKVIVSQTFPLYRREAINGYDFCDISLCVCWSGGFLSVIPLASQVPQRTGCQTRDPQRRGPSFSRGECTLEGERATLKHLAERAGEYLLAL